MCKKSRRFLPTVLFGLTILGASLFLCGCGSEQATSTPPNIILIFADDLGYSDLSCYGHPTIQTPNLDQMAEEGIRLTSFYSTAALCTPSRVALMTGRYPIRTGLVNNLGPDSVGGLPLNEILIPQALKKVGYKTMAIGKWHLGHDPIEYMPTHRGFDAYYGLRYSNDMYPPWVQTEILLELYQDTQPIEHPVNQNTLTKRYTEEAIRFIRANRARPFFIYLPHAMPHVPLHTSEAFRESSEAGLYGDVIQELDWSVGRILETLQELDLDKDTLVIFTSDNGPWMNMPDRMLKRGIELWHAGTAGFFRESKGSTYEGGTRVPFIARWPQLIPPGQVSADMACTMDLYTTIIETAGGQVPQDRDVDGINILDFLKGETPTPREVYFYYRGQQLRAVRKGKWKFRLNYVNRRTRESDQLFNLEADPGELYNVVDRFPEVAGELFQLIQDMYIQLGSEPPERK